MPPTLSIIMSAYNAESYLKDSVSSILEQDYRDFEFIITNDASTDQTSTILSQLAQQDSRIQIITNPQNIGLTASLIKGIHQSRGSFIARQDADDISLPHRLKTQIDILQRNLDAALATCSIDIINQCGSLQQSKRHSPPAHQIPWFLLFYNCLAGHGQIVFRKEAYDRSGGYKSSIRYAQDYDLWVRMMKERFIVIPETLYHKRHLPDQISHRHSDSQENFAIQSSKWALHHHLGIDFSEDEIKDLRAFWQRKFDSIQSPRQLSHSLSRCWKNYSSHFPSPSSSETKSLIRTQYKKWILKKKLRISKKIEGCFSYIHF